MTTDNSMRQAEKLYHYLTEKLDLTQTQKQTLWDELHGWFGVSLEADRVKGSTKNHVQQLIQRMG